MKGIRIVVALWYLAIQHVSAIDIQFPALPDVGADFQVVISSTGDVGCEDSISQQSTIFHGEGTRTVSLGVVPDVGFYTLLFTDNVTGDRVVYVASVFAQGDGDVRASQTAVSTLDKFLGQMTSDNLRRWFASWNKAQELSTKIVQITGTGTLLLVCFNGVPFACTQAAVSGVDTISDLIADFLEYIISQMTSADKTLPCAP